MEQSEKEVKKDLYKRVFGSEDGQLVLQDLMKFAKIKQTGFNAESDRVTSYNLGKKELCQYIINLYTE